jgi:wyosine [tRNA(Phe)-imidazoG37] synthetase (radical SAM superfamily)
MKHIFGPVLSRRLGLSLGVDLLPPTKVCSMDCIYCECGRTDRKYLTLERREWVSTEEVKRELEEILTREDIVLDFVTFSGNGEPTLHTKFGEIAKFIKQLRPDIKLALLTNASTLWMDEVLNQLEPFDVISPSLDAGTEKVFKKINHPAKGLTLDKVILGLEKLKKNYKGQIWLETLFVKGINDNPQEVKAIGKLVHKLEPTRWQINTVVRPPAYNVRGLTEEELIEIAKEVNYPNTDIVCYNYLKMEDIAKKPSKAEEVEEKLLQMVKRRPSPFKEVMVALGLTEEGLEELLEKLIKEGKIKVETYDDEKFLRATQI